MSRFFPKDLVINITYLPNEKLSDHYPMIVEFGPLYSLKEDFDLRKEWEAIDLAKAFEKREKLIWQAEEALIRKDIEGYRMAINKIITSKDVKALAVEKTLKAKVNPNIKEMNWHFTHNRMRALKEIDLLHHKMDKVFFFEVEEKVRKIGKLSSKDYAAHIMVKQMIKPFHDLTCDTHSFAYLEGRSHLDVHRILQKWLREKNYNWIGLIDIKNFFGSIDHEWLCRNIPVPKNCLKNILTCENVIDGKTVPSAGEDLFQCVCFWYQHHR